jgi:hypothetical protein
MVTQTVTRRLIRMILCAAFLGVPATIAVASNSSAATVACTAHVNNPNPTDYSTVTVLIHTRSNARISTTAHYMSTDTVKTTQANASGTASVAYRISRATSGFRVIVTVVARSGSLIGSCSTSFTPV